MYKKELAFSNVNNANVSWSITNNPTNQPTNQPPNEFIFEKIFQENIFWSKLLHSLRYPRVVIV